MVSAPLRPAAVVDFAGSKGDTDMDATGRDILHKFVGALNKGAHTH
jgi:hypothetical protein